MGESRTTRDQYERKCFACDKRLGKKPALVTCADEQTVYVGSECYKRIVAGGIAGYKPVDGGPRLYTLENKPKEFTSHE